LKARLPVLGSLPSEPRRQAALAPERLASPRPLICVVGVDGAAACLEFGLTLAGAIRAMGGVPAVLLASSDGEWSTKAVARLRDEGACEVHVLREPGIADATMAALADLVLGSICVGIGWPIAACVRGLLLIRVGGPAGGLDPQQADAVDLDTTTEGLGVAAMLGTWLAQRLDAAAPNGYSPEVAERTNA